jgi:hypothetical protein
VPRESSKGRLFVLRGSCEKGQTMTAEIGEVAPDFSLPTANNETISLAQFRGQKHVILSFHVFNFTSG